MQAEMRWLEWDRDYQEARLGKQLRDVHALCRGLKSRSLLEHPAAAGQSGAGHTSLDRL